MHRLAWLGFALVACHAASPEVANAPDAAASPADADGFPYPPPRTDVVPAIGHADTLELAAWNIENFPASSDTPSRVADLIASLDLDIIVVEEIADEAAWHELIERLRDHEGILSEHRYTPTEYQKIGLIYRTSMVTPSMIEQLFPHESYVFPRPPYATSLAIDDGIHRPISLRTIGVHLKAGVAVEDGERRRRAVQILDAHVREQIASGAEDQIVIAGDYNEVLTTTTGRDRLAPLLTAPEMYTVRTVDAAAAGQISFVPSHKLIDHITTTAALGDALAEAHVVIPRLDAIAGYVDDVSDHLPVVLVAPL